MKPRAIRLLIAVLAVVAVLCAATAGGAWLLLDYALVPRSDGRDTSATWRAMSARYPGLASWRDSLSREGTLRDTFLTAPDGTRLHAFYARAARPTGRTALLVHGYTDNALSMMMLGRMYREALRANILLPDLRRAGQSEGSHVTMGLIDSRDLHGWLAVAGSLGGDSSRIVVHGISMGAATAMMLSGDTLPPAVCAFVEDCGYTSVRDQFAKELRRRFGLPEFPLLSVASALCRLRYGWGFDEASALKGVARCPLPMLFIHGGNDDYVPTAMVYPLYRTKPAPKALWIVPGAAHARSFCDRPAEYRQRVERFLAPWW